MSELPSTFLSKSYACNDSASAASLTDSIRAICDWRAGSASKRDEYELQYARTWLKKLIKTSSDGALVEAAALCLTDLDRPEGAKASRAKMQLHLTASLADEAAKQLLSFETAAGSVKVRLQETSMQDANATGFCTWSSAIVLARQVFADPLALLPNDEPRHGAAPLKVLELGSGTGLCGIACLTALGGAGVQVEVTLTDYDEQTLSTLETNIEQNLAAGGTNVSWKVRKLDWKDAATFTGGPFDIIIGADIVYEPYHAKLVHNAVAALLKSGGVFHLVIPIRYTHAADVAALEQAFVGGEASSKPFIRKITDTEQSDVGQYAHRYYVIGRE